MSCNLLWLRLPTLIKSIISAIIRTISRRKMHGKGYFRWFSAQFPLVTMAIFEANFIVVVVSGDYWCLLVSIEGSDETGTSNKWR